MVQELIRDDPAMPSLLDLRNNNIASRLCRYSIDAILSNRLFQPLQQRGTKVDCHVPIPTPGSLGLTWKIVRRELFDSLKHTLLVSEADDDLRYTKQKALQPETQRLLDEELPVSVRRRLGRRLEFDPVVLG